jgi:alpha-ketoglutarate-dependent 2,4-dichlorophenoxyacetate dioxygenase
MSTFQIEPLHAEFGAKLTGLDLTQALDENTTAALWDAIDAYSFIWAPSQVFDDDKQLAFTRSLGKAQASHVAQGEEGRIEYFGTIGNVQADGTTIGSDHRKTKFLTGNNVWHTDASFKPTPAALSIMCAYETPSEGGHTQFVSARAAYDRLTASEQAQADPLIAVHDYTFSRSKVAPDAVSPALSASLPPVRHKLVRCNQKAAAKNLFIGSHVREIEGWAETDSRVYLDNMVEHATGQDHIFTHAWAPGDLVIWDNRCLLHRGSGYDADKHRRMMRQTRVSGECPTLDE